MLGQPQNAVFGAELSRCPEQPRRGLSCRSGSIILRLKKTMAIRGFFGNHASRSLKLLRNTRRWSSSSPVSSVNPTEVSHFRDLASTWWDPHGSSRLLHLMNPLRHDFISSCVAPHTGPASSKLRYLDVGCGGGIFAESAARLITTEKVIGIDPTPEVLKVAQEHARLDPKLCDTSRLQYLNKSIEELPKPTSPDGQFDVLTLWEVLEHVKLPAAFLDSCLPFVKPGGWIVLSTIARSLISWVTTKLVAENLARIVPLGTHDWTNYVNHQELSQFFRGKPGWASNDGLRVTGCMYIPGLGWTMANGSEAWGNYFFGVRKDI